MIDLKSVTPALGCYVEDYGCKTSFPNSLMAWLHEFQYRASSARRPISGRPRISSDDVAGT